MAHEFEFEFEFEFEWGVYAQSASEAIFRVRTYSHKLLGPVLIIT